MKNFYEKALIISPHSDDEIFTFPFIYSKENKFGSIDLLLIEKDSKRYQEALKSAKLNSLNLIVMPNKVNFKGLSFHKNFNYLVKYFKKLWKRYDLILVPLIEGGHQDHDSTCAALFLSKVGNGYDTKVVLYSTYRGFEFLPWIYTCGISSKYKPINIFRVTPKKSLYYHFFKTIFVCYKSQIKTWLFLFPALLKSYLRMDYNKFVNGDNLTFKDLVSKSPNLPLYQIYRGLTKKQWERSLISIENKKTKLYDNFK